jgi:hypothetical protein
LGPLDRKCCGRGTLVGACRKSVSWILAGSWDHAVDIFTTYIWKINMIWLPCALDRHLTHQTLIVGYMDEKCCGRGTLVGACRKSVSWISAWFYFNSNVLSNISRSET